MTSEQKFWARTKQQGECLLWLGAKIWNGYGKLGRDGATWTAHRYAYFLTHGSIPEGLHVCHRCDNRLCVKPEHLFAATRTENMRDMMNKGRGRWPGLSRGSRSPFSKFIEADIAEMRKKFDAGATLKELAAQYNTTPSYASALVRGNHWRHVGVKSEKVGRSRRDKKNANSSDAP